MELLPLRETKKIKFAKNYLNKPTSQQSVLYELTQAFLFFVVLYHDKKSGSLMMMMLFPF